MNRGSCKDCKHCTPSQDGSGGLCEALAYDNNGWHNKKKFMKYGVQLNWWCCKHQSKLKGTANEIECSKITDEKNDRGGVLPPQNLNERKD